MGYFGDKDRDDEQGDLGYGCLLILFLVFYVVIRSVIWLLGG